MSFNPDVRNQAQEVIFSRKQAKSVNPDLVFNNTPVHQTHSLPETFRSIFRQEIKF